MDKFLYDYIYPSIAIFAISFSLCVFVLPIAFDREMERQRAQEAAFYEVGYIE